MELSIPCIYENNECIGYGGDQEWFKDKWAKKAGCASVLASNLYGYYHQQSSYSKAEFLDIMNEMFLLMKPGTMGYPYLYKFARTFVKRINEDHFHLEPVYQKKSLSHQHALSFVLESIDDNHPVSMLILHHNAKELEDDNWHWICLSGYERKDNNDLIIFSDCGERRIIDSKILFDTHYKNVFKMVRMKKVPKQ
ncbi:MAG: hypothetical protein RR630_00925 [Coprobacillus sp.]